MSVRSSSEYYEKVSNYYNDCAVDYDNQHWNNQLLITIRQSFRDIVDAYPFKKVLEIGYGHGLDSIYFAKKHPETQFYGIDVAAQMYECAIKNTDKANVKNVTLLHGSVEEIIEKFEGKKFDMIFVFFGALNTAPDLKDAAKQLEQVLEKDGKMVLTFVNKWYLKGILIPMLKLKFKIAFARLKKVWNGYSYTKLLPSRCYSIREIKQAFKQFEVKLIKGYSITYPAWYENQKFTNKRLLNFLWRLDTVFSTNLTRGLGEYSLFVFQKKG